MAEFSSNKKGERTMSQGFIAQYAAEAALRTYGVARLDEGGVAAIKSAFGFEHEGKGVQVTFNSRDEATCEITVYPVVYFATIVPEVAWNIQENVKSDVEKYTGVDVEAVNVHVKDIVRKEEEKPHAQSQ